MHNQNTFGEASLTSPPYESAEALEEVRIINTTDH